MNAGYVYILTNKGYAPNLLKIGMTTRTPQDRAREMFEGSTGVPYPFKVAFSHRVSDCEQAERIVHARLGQFRAVHFREFFEVDLDVAISALKEVCAEVDLHHPVPMPVPAIRRHAIDDRPFTYTEPPKRSNAMTGQDWIRAAFAIIFILAIIRAFL
jgi:hypothetical protein